MDESKQSIKDTWARPRGVEGGGVSFMSASAPKAQRPGDLFRQADEEQALKAVSAKQAQGKSERQ